MPLSLAARSAGLAAPSSARLAVRRSPASLTTRALFGWGESAEDKERRQEQWEAQQAILQRRKSGSWRKVTFESSPHTRPWRGGGQRRACVQVVVVGGVRQKQ
jgi:hypothetical protein